MTRPQDACHDDCDCWTLSGVSIGPSELSPTPTDAGRSVRRGDFRAVSEALDYAGLQRTGINIHSLRGELVESLTYAALSEEARRLAAQLLAAGLEPGDRVALAAGQRGSGSPRRWTVRGGSRDRRVPLVALGQVRLAGCAASWMRRHCAPTPSSTIRAPLGRAPRANGCSRATRRCTRSSPGSLRRPEPDPILRRRAFAPRRRMTTPHHTSGDTACHENRNRTGRRRSPRFLHPRRCR